MRLRKKCQLVFFALPPCLPAIKTATKKRELEPRSWENGSRDYQSLKGSQEEKESNGAENEGEICSDGNMNMSSSGVEKLSEFPLLSTAGATAERWSQGERAYPLKKRRINSNKWQEQEEESKAEENKELIRTNLDHDQEEQVNINKEREGSMDDISNIPAAINVTDTTINTYSSNTINPTNLRFTCVVEKTMARSALMAGKCSRTNGKGWRCNRQTRRGYSLCDYHNKKKNRASLGNSSSIKSHMSHKKMNAMEEDGLMVSVEDEEGFRVVKKTRSLAGLLKQSPTR